MDWKKVAVGKSAASLLNEYSQHHFKVLPSYEHHVTGLLQCDIEDEWCAYLTSLPWQEMRTSPSAAKSR